MYLLTYYEICPINFEDVQCDYRTPGMAWDIAIRDTFAFIADGDSGLCIINVSDVTNPVKVNTIPTGN